MKKQFLWLISGIIVGAIFTTILNPLTTKAIQGAAKTITDVWNYIGIVDMQIVTTQKLITDIDLDIWTIKRDVKSIKKSVNTIKKECQYY